MNFTPLPIVDPHKPGQLWNNEGVITLSEPDVWFGAGWRDHVYDEPDIGEDE